MCLKVIGVLIVVTACSLMGFALANEYIAKINNLDAFKKSLRILKPIHMPNHFPASLQPSFRWMIILYSMLSNVTQSALLHYICLKQIHVPVTRLQIFESLLKQRKFQFHHLQLIFPYTKHPVSLCIVYFFYISVLFQTVSRNPG